MKNVIFDFDGTLADTATGIIAAEKILLEELGLPPRTDEQIRAAIGLPLAEALHVGGAIPEDLLQKSCDRYHELFMIHAPRYILLFNGVKETLTDLQLRGINMAIATSRGSESLNWLLQNLGIEQFFCMNITAGDTVRHKPHPEPVLVILNKMGWKACETLVVGDTIFDIQMGNGAGCPTLGVTYGNHSREKLISASPSFLVDSFAGILDAF